jgi:tetratricopeptide (TPR) repeat protein
MIFIALAWWYISVQNKAQSAVAWDDYIRAVSSGTHQEQLLEDLAQQNAGSMVANWARLTLADWKLEDGSGRLLTDRAAAKEQLVEASETFRALESVNNASIQERAGYGLARSYEAMGELEKARTAYNELAEKFPEGPFAAAAKSRAAKLEQHNTKAFYDWLASYEPPAPLSNEPGTPGARPDFLKEPDAGTLKVPSTLTDPALKLPGLGNEPAAEEAGTTENAPLIPGADATPADPAPAEESKPVEVAPGTGSSQ